MSSVTRSVYITPMNMVMGVMILPKYLGNSMLTEMDKEIVLANTVITLIFRLVVVIVLQVIELTRVIRLSFRITILWHILLAVTNQTEQLLLPVK